MRPVCIGRERFARRRDLCIIGKGLPAAWRSRRPPSLMQPVCIGRERCAAAGIPAGQPFGWTTASTFRLGSMNQAAHE